MANVLGGGADAGEVSSEQPGTAKPGVGEPGAETVEPIQQTTTQFGHLVVTGGISAGSG